MQARKDRSLEVIGDGLRDVWRDVVDSPLPARIRHLLDELCRREREARPEVGKIKRTAPVPDKG